VRKGQIKGGNLLFDGANYHYNLVHNRNAKMTADVFRAKIDILLAQIPSGCADESMPLPCW
jgi:hypothetical protein